MQNINKNDINRMLEILKDTLDNFNRKKNNNILFINMKGFYSYLENFNKSNISINSIMDKIEKNIPLKLFIDAETLQILRLGLIARNLNYIKNLKNTFHKNAILKFFKLISNAKTEKQWNNILEACEKALI